MTGNTIDFLLHNEPRHLDNVDANLTVLNYLRIEERLIGTKEGCAEGDCGACTVVVTEPRDGKLNYQAVNSCIMFVSALHGRQLITVEHLRDNDNNLHPVQQALVDEHGSQCGFCTPGFVMSLFAMYHDGTSADKTSIDDALAGNLCRCTGYAPIVRAAKKVLTSVATDEFDRNESSTIERLNKIGNDSVRINGERTRLYAPATVKQLTKFLKVEPDAQIVAGATDVGLWVTKEFRRLPSIVYVGGVQSLRQVEVVDGVLYIGAAATISDAMELLVAHFPALETQLIRFGSVQIRNLATICGNVANGSPIGDSLPALVALGARVRLTDHDGSRTIPVEDFFIDYGKQDLRSGEFVERIEIPLLRQDQEFRIYKISKRFHQDISAVCGAYFVQIVNNQIHKIRICYGGMAAIPKRALHAESVLQDASLSAAAIEAAKQATAKDFIPISDFRASADYRLSAAQNLLERLHRDLTGEQAGSVWDLKYA